MKKNKIWITGSGMVGKALIKKLSTNKKYQILRSSKNKLDQINQTKTDSWIKKNRPDTIIISSALVGGIQLNSSIPADFLYQNSMMYLNIINSAHNYGCKKIIFLGASCMYPKLGKQPFKENLILNGKIEETNEGYGISKILGVKFLELINKQYLTNHISIIPAASYGPNDCYDENKNHVIPALINKFHTAKIKKRSQVNIWGSGNVKREFIHVDDMASGIIHIIENYRENSPINLGTGEEFTIKKLANIIKKVVNYKGKIEFDKSKPDGIKRKILDNSRLKKLGWKPNISIEEGIKNTYQDFLKNKI